MSVDGAESRPGGRWRLRVEDWILTAWVALVAPALFHAEHSDAGPFAHGRPVDGLLGIVALVGVGLCLGLKRTDGKGEFPKAALGPFVGGLLFVTIDTASALDLSPAVVTLGGLALFVAAVLLRVRGPAPTTALRRALVTPYVTVAGGIFWNLIGAVTSGGALPAKIRSVAASNLRAVLPIVGFLLAFSAVHYAMLVFAPRQVAEREGGAIAWLARYALFVVGVGLGAGWLAVLSG